MPTQKRDNRPSPEIGIRLVRAKAFQEYQSSTLQIPSPRQNITSWEFFISSKLRTLKNALRPSAAAANGINHSLGHRCQVEGRLKQVLKALR